MISQMTRPQQPKLLTRGRILPGGGRSIPDNEGDEEDDNDYGDDDKGDCDEDDDNDNNNDNADDDDLFFYSVIQVGP